MGYQTPYFPGMIWDGSSDNPDRLGREYNVDPDFNDWDTISAELIAVQEYILQLPITPAGAIFPVYSAEAADTIVTGQLVAIQLDGSLELADSDSSTLSGLALTGGGVGQQVVYLADGQISSTDWTATTGTVALQTGADYYLRQNGMMETSPPSTGYLIKVGQAQSATSFQINIQSSIKL